MRGTNVLAYATLAVGAGVVTLVTDASPVLPAKCNHVFITCETQPVRWTADGTAPSQTVGHVLAKDDSISFTGAGYRSLLEKLKFYDTSAGEGALKITYFD